MSLPLGLTTSDIVRHAKSIDGFGGLVTYDQIPDKITDKSKFYLILTISPDEQCGSGHYVMIDMRDPNYAYYFDALGDPPDDIRNDYDDAVGKDNLKITKFLKSLNENVYMNKKKYQIECNDINTCGQWVLLAAKYPPKKFSKFWEYMQQPYGDPIILTLFKQHFI